MMILSAPFIQTDTVDVLFGGGTTRCTITDMRLRFELNYTTLRTFHCSFMEEGPEALPIGGV